MRRTGFAIGFFILLLLHSIAQAQMGDWRHYSGDAASSKYAPLSQINRENFADLRVVWRYRPPDQKLAQANAGLRSTYNKVTPLEVDGVLYYTSPYQVVGALDAATGQELWTFDPEVWKHDVNALGMFRGLTYWCDGDDERLFLATQNSRLYAIDPKTGTPDSAFGQGGYVDLTKGLRREIDPESYGVTSPPVVSRGVVVVGSSVLDVRYRPTPEYSNPGDVRGFDARTGEQIWTFQTIPQEGEYGNETWGMDSWQRHGGVNVWSMMSVDEELGYVYMPVSTPSGDFYGGERPGDNLFGDSILCLKAETGERVWHFQLIHHGIWDYDPPAAPILADIEVDDKKIKAVVQLTKQGFCFVFDRISGAPVWPIEEKPVPTTGGVAGERLSPTQPFPSKPAPYDWQGVSEENLIDFTPELRQKALQILDDYDYGPLYTPPTEKGLLLVPGLFGGANWVGGALQPDKGLLYVPSHTLPAQVKLHAVEDDSAHTAFYGGTRNRVGGPENLPLLKPPYGRITAIDLNSGEHRWMKPLGRGPKDHPALKDLDLEEDLGWDDFAFVLATDELLIATMSDPRDYGDAGQSYFVDREAALMALDLDTGAKLGRVPLPSNANGNPMTYMADGRQYIVVPLGSWDNRPAEWVALALPREGEKLPNQPGARHDAEHEEFYAAVAAFDAGDLEQLQKLLADNEGLAKARGFLDEYYEYTQLRGATLLHLIAGQPQRAMLPENVVDLTRALLAAGVDPNAASLDSSFALELILASAQADWAKRKEELVSLLVTGGADPGINKSKLLWAALVNNNEKMAALLAEKGASLDLRLAAGLGQLEQMTTFFDAKGRLLPVANSLYRVNADTVLSDQQILDEALHFAVYQDRREAIDFLLEKGADIDSHVGAMWEWDWGTTPLIKAVDAGKLDLIRYLVERGADLSVAEPRWNETPYVWSTYYSGEEHAQITKALREMETKQKNEQEQSSE